MAEMCTQAKSMTRTTLANSNGSTNELHDMEKLHSSRTCNLHLRRKKIMNCV